MVCFWRLFSVMNFFMWSVFCFLRENMMSFMFCCFLKSWCLWCGVVVERDWGLDWWVSGCIRCFVFW